MAITFRQLRYFLVLAEELHFGRAAKRLHISQPPLSTSLRQLEDELGVRLLERSSKHVAMTPAGQAFYRQSRRVLEQLEDSQELVKRIASSPAGLLRVGFTPAMLFRQLPDAMAELQTSHPGIDVQLIEKNSAEQVEAIAMGKLDLGFIHAIPLPPDIASLTIADEAFLCCLPTHHPLAMRDTLTIRDLVGEPLVMFNRSLAPHYYDRIIGLFHVADAEPTIKHEVSYWLTIVTLISRGMGIALIPEALANSVISNVRFIPMADCSMRHQSQCIWLEDIDNTNRDLLIDCVRGQSGHIKS
ncbi:MAG TPA: LysR family transcriptional regulator [Halomonas sp.]|nr:LysR family transcriptional regulator [Halomonas sp.]